MSGLSQSKQIIFSLTPVMWLLAAGAGAGAPGPGELVFQDPFQGRLGDGWSWVREEPGNWRVGPGWLEVRVQPGGLWGGGNNARNVLVRPLPPPAGAPVEISVTFSNRPAARWEQSNLAWYYDDSNMVKLGQELVADRLTIVMGREENDRTRTVAIVPLDDYTVELRLQAVEKRIRGQFRTRHWQNWRDAGECDLPVQGEAKASLQFYNGSAALEHWSRATGFAVRRWVPSGADWPRVRAEERKASAKGGELAVSKPEGLPLAHGFTLVNGLQGVTLPGTQPHFDQAVYRHADGSFGWCWDRRASGSKTPNRPGVEFRPPEFPLGLAAVKNIAVESDVVARLNIDRPDHRVLLAVALANQPEAEAGAGLQLQLCFDWYGKDWTGAAIGDGQRSYAFDAGGSDAQRLLYRLQGLRGVPPRVNLGPLIEDALRRAGWEARRTWVRSVWLGNEVWDGSFGQTLVTKLDVVVNERRYPATRP